MEKKKTMSEAILIHKHLLGNGYLTFYSDNQRHLICEPYSRENLHKMAHLLDIKHCWFHTKPYDHYDIPVRRMKEIQDQTEIVPRRRIIEIIKKGLNK